MRPLAPKQEHPAITLKLRGISFSLTGRSALVAVSAVLVLLAVLLVYMVNNKTETLESAMSPLWVSGGLWILFIGYWSAAARKTSPTRTSESQASRSFHQILLYGALILAFARVPGLGGRWLPEAPLIVPIGLALQAGSGLLAVWARRHLGRNWSGAITAKVDHQLIRTGPYRVIRHPIYSAMLGMFVGTALVSGEVHGLVAVLVIAIAYWRKILREERNLHEVFGTAYDDYRRESHALIPWLL